MSNAIKKLKTDEKKIIMAYAVNKLQLNRLSKELDTMKQNVVDVFEEQIKTLLLFKMRMVVAMECRKSNVKEKSLKLLTSKSNTMIYSISFVLRLNIMSSKQ